MGYMEDDSPTTEIGLVVSRGYWKYSRDGRGGNHARASAKLPQNQNLDNYTDEELEGMERASRGGREKDEGFREP